MYTALVGKPYEISFQYAEMMANKVARSKGQSKIERMYFVGYVFLRFFIQFFTFSLFFFRDNPEVDIVGANVYNAFLQKAASSNESLTACGLLSHPRLLSAKICESILVCTGVYDPEVHELNPKQPWGMPTTIQFDALKAVEYVLKKENIV